MRAHGYKEGNKKTELLLLVDDYQKANNYSEIYEFRNKSVTAEIFNEIPDHYFPQEI
jgi:hypothetical protein